MVGKPCTTELYSISWPLTIYLKNICCRDWKEMAWQLRAYCSCRTPMLGGSHLSATLVLGGFDIPF